jgi:hypothetical protein
MYRKVLLLMLLAAGCRESKSPPATKAATPPSVTPATDAGASAGAGGGTGTGATNEPQKQAPVAAPDAAPAAVVLPEPKEREDGPTRATCEELADHLGGFVVDSMVPANATETQRSYAEKLVKDDRPNVVRFCVESATKEEAECVIKAADFPTLAACERFRRQVPKDLAKRDEVTPDDCEKVFTRIKQMKMDEGYAADDIDKTKDQIVRACEEKAKPGTVACIISSRSWEEAKRCP